MSFAIPLWLLAGAVACLGVVWSWRRYDARQQIALGQFVSAHLRVSLTRSVSSARRLVKRGVLLGAIALLFIALAGPQLGYQWTQVTRRGNDIIFAVDTSRSMLTPDVKPDRLERAKLAIDDFVTHLDGDAVGLIAFAGSAFLQTPLTLDYGAFHESLGALDTNIIPRGGTDITSAIREAQSALRDRPGSDKILVLVTDGEDLEGNALAAAKTAAAQGLKIYTVGVGSANGDLIPLPPDQGGGFVRDAAGNPVKSRLDEAGLKAIAQATGGLYAPLGAEGQGLEMIYRQALAPLVKHDLASRQQRVPLQRYQWPLAAALGLLLTGQLIGTRRRLTVERNATRGEPMGSNVMVRAVAGLFGLMLLMPIHSAHASATTAAKAYAKGDFAAASREFAAAAQGNPKQPALQYDAGTAAYRAGQFPQAAAAFQASLNGRLSADAQRLAEQESSYYDLGNTLYRIGQSTEQGNPAQTIQTWTQSVKAYDAALQLSAHDADSQFNRDLVQRKLEQLKQQQSQQNQQNKPSQSDSKSAQNQPQQKSAGNQPEKSQGKGQSKDQQSGQSQSAQMAQNNKPQSGTPSGSGTSPPNQPKESGQQGPQQASGAGQSPSNQHQEQEQMAEDNQSLPGQMSREEARELLDSVKGDSHRFPVASVTGNGTRTNASDEASKDW